MIPIENSIAGRVADIHHLLPTSGLHIVGEYFLPIHFQLMALPGADARGHQDGAQPCPCARPMPQHHPQARLASRWSPATRPARRARSRNAATRRRAALAPRLAAEIYGLDILRRERRGRGAQHHALRHPVARAEAGRRRQRAVRDDLRLPRPQRSGRALQGARRLRHQRRQHDQARKLHGRRRFFATQFYADVEGHPDDRALERALEELAFFSREVRILGVYPAGPFRDKMQTPAE